MYFSFTYRLVIDDLNYDKLYMLNMNISVCFESRGPCVINSAVIFKNSLLPKTLCDFSMRSTRKGTCHQQ